MIFLLPLAFLGSLVSILYELVLAKTLAALTDESSLWECLTFGIYIASIGLGVLSQKTLISFNESVIRQRLFVTEVKLCGLGLISIPSILLFHIFYRLYLYDYGLFAHELWILRPLHHFALFSQIFTIGIGYYAGVELALIFRWESWQRQYREQGPQVFLLWSCYYLGALVGSLVFSLYCVKFLSSGYAALLASTLNIMLLIYLYMHNRVLLKNKSDILYILGLISLGCYSFLQIPHLESWQRKNFYYNVLSSSYRSGQVVKWVGPVSGWDVFSFLESLPSVERRKSHYQTLDLVSPLRVGGNSQKIPSKHHSLFLNGHFQYDTLKEADYHEHMAHDPLYFLQSVPKRVLVLGGGDGLLMRELLKYENIEKVQLVEIDPEMIKLARQVPLSEVNHNSLSDPRVEIVLDDAMRWLKQRHESEPFDAVFIDFPFPYDSDGIRLYSSDFFRLVAAQLSESGFLVIDVPLHLERMRKTDLILLNTLYFGGFKQLLGFRSLRDTFLLASRKNLKVGEIYQAWPQLKLTSYDLDAWHSSDRFYPIEFQAEIKWANTLLKPQRLVERDPSF